MSKLFFMAVVLVSFSSVAEEIDLSKSSFTWSGRKVTGDIHSGPIKMKKAVVKNGKGQLVADLKTIDDTTLKGKWKKKFLDHVKSADFFDVKKFPTATLKIEKIDIIEKNKKAERGYLFGQLTVKGKTNPVTVPFTKKGKVYNGEMGFDRTKYGMVYGSGNFFKNLGDKMIRDTVTLEFKIVTK